MALDYVGSYKKTHSADDQQLLHYGVKGMHWGVRRSSGSGSSVTRVTSSRIKATKPTRARSKEEHDIARAKQVEKLSVLKEKVKTGNAIVAKGGKRLSTQQAVKSLDKDIAKLSKNNPVLAKKISGNSADHRQDGENSPKKELDASGNETSISRYNRLQTQAKTKGVHTLEDDDLKFLNARREALSKAEAAYRKPESKIQKAVKAALTMAVTKHLNNHTDAVIQSLLAGKKTKVPISPNIIKVKTNSTTRSPANHTPVFNITSMGRPDPYMSTSRTTILNQSLVRAG